MTTERPNKNSAELEPCQFNPELFQATVVLLSDYPKRPVDALFFFGRSWFDAGKGDLFLLASDLYRAGMIKNIVIPGTEGERFGETVPHQANPGRTLWTSRLVRMEIPPEVIHHSKAGYHTKAEGDAFLEMAQKEGWRSAVSLTHPHQAVRAMLGLVRTINIQELNFDVYAVAPQTTNWGKRVKGSQGLERKSRFEHIEGEFERIIRYQEKGDLASFQELFAYLEQRNARIRPTSLGQT